MKKIGIILSLLAFVACKENKNENEPAVANETAAVQEKTAEVAYNTYGDKITDEGVLDPLQAQEKFEKLQPGDTLNLKFEAKVMEVCKKKGCWMKMVMPNEKEPMVRFKDYAFFVPKDIDGKNVIVEGKAYLTEVSVEDQQHYAKDGGKSEEEINAITEPKQTISVMANGVLIKK